MRPCGSVVVDWADGGGVDEYTAEGAATLRVDAAGAVCDWHAPGWIYSGYIDVEQAEIELRFATDPDAVIRWRTPRPPAMGKPRRKSTPRGTKRGVAA